MGGSQANRKAYRRRWRLVGKMKCWGLRSGIRGLVGAISPPVWSPVGCPGRRGQSPALGGSEEWETPEPSRPRRWLSRRVGRNGRGMLR